METLKKQLENSSATLQKSVQWLVSLPPIVACDVYFLRETRIDIWLTGYRNREFIKLRGKAEILKNLERAITTVACFLIKSRND